MYHRWNRVAAVLALLYCLWPVSVSLGGSLRYASDDPLSKIDPALQQKLQNTDAKQSVEVELAVTNAISAEELTQFLDRNYVTLDDKRRAGLRLLRETAATTQKDLLLYFNRLQQSGIVSNIKSHWLTNTISIKLKASWVDSVSQRSDVRAIYQEPSFQAIKPGDPLPPPATLSATEAESNLRYIGADTAWRLGYTGAGRIVCVFDFTGVDGHHPALAARWKGLDGDSAAAWEGGGFPKCGHWLDKDSSHGTMMTGILIGHDDVTGDTVGVAPGARWIGARFPEWGWAADPDNDPNTTADMPDVINFSMGSPGECETRWATDNEIDMVEALGIVVIFAAGNSGSAPYSVWAPAARAQDSLTNFAVGSVDHRTSDVWWSSSRGPSLCDSVSIKPNACAPGAYIRCAVPGGGYEYHGGTSMAAPHVSGSVAILRQYAPNATTRQIKEALLAGATPRGVGHPNNDYGWGIISIPRAMEFLGHRALADLRMSAFDYVPTNVWDTLSAEISVTNRGVSIDSAYLKFPDRQAGLRVVNDSIYLGSIDCAQVVHGQIPLKCVFEDTLLGGPTFRLPYAIHGAGGYLDSSTAQLKVGIEGRYSEKFFRTPSGLFLTGNHGGYLLWWELVTPPECPDPYDCDTITPFLFSRLYFLLASDSNKVSDNYRTERYYNDEDFWVDARYRMTELTPGSKADEEIECTFNDGLAENQIGVEVHQISYHWKPTQVDNIVLLEYQLYNPTSKFIDNLRVGFGVEVGGLDGYAPPCSSPDSQIFRSQYFNDERLGFLKVSPCGLDTTRYLGIEALSKGGQCSFWAESLPWSPGPIGPSERQKYKALTTTLPREGITSGGKNGLVQFMSSGPLTLNPSQSDTVAFALLLANSVEELQSSAKVAHDKWKDVSPTQNLPESFLLSQNYPNPFNPSTTIFFDMPTSGRAKLTIYNVLGQVVTTLVNEDLAAGTHQAFWNGTSSRNGLVASGVYFYRLETQGFVQSKKMMLLR